MDTLTSLNNDYQVYVDHTNAIYQIERRSKLLGAEELSIAFQTIEAEKKNEALKKRLEELEAETAVRFFFRYL